MRKFILAAIVLAGGLSAVQDADAFFWRSRRWGAGDHYQSGYQYRRSPREGVYYDSGIAFEYEWDYPRHSNRRSRIYYDSGIAFDAE